MAVKHSNFYSNTLATPPTGITEAAFTVTSAVGLPPLGVGDTCYVVLKNASLTREIIKITTIVGTTLTPAVGGRGVDGSAVYASWLAGDVIELCAVNASLLDLLYEFKNNFFNVANTVKSVFRNTNTAPRTYTSADRDGNIITDADINAATAKATPADADILLLLDSAAAFALKKITVANATFATGTRSVFVQNFAPTGWVTDTAVTDQVLIAYPPFGGNTTGGSWTISGLPSVSGGTAISILQMPIHTHPYGGNTVVLTTAGSGGIEPALNTAHVTGPQGGGLPHTHPLTSTSDGIWRPSWRGVIVCQKS